MDYGYNQGFSAGINRHTSCISSILHSPTSISRLTKVRKSLLRASLIPFAVVTSTFITGLSSHAYAAVKNPQDITAHKSNHVEHQGPIDTVVATFKEFNQTVASIKDWFEGVPTDIAQGSVHLMAWLYDLCATLILKTPLWIFDNEWFENTTYMFSLLSIGLVSTLTVVEGIKRMLSGIRKSGFKGIKAPMELKDIMKRWFIVAGVTTAVPFAFQKAFQGLNIASDFLIGMGKRTMDNVAVPETVSLIDALTLTVFDIILISTIVPILWKNGRRFFDLMLLGVTSPLALTAWIFDPYRHYFSQWWSNLKHLSMVQVYYSLFLLVLGWFIFGVPTPVQFSGLIVKLLITIGGFARMANPPRIIASKLDTGGGFDDYNATKKKVVQNFKDTKAIIGGPVSTGKMLYGKITTPTEREGGTRMERYHSRMEKIGLAKKKPEAPKPTPKPRKR